LRVAGERVPVRAQRAFAFQDHEHLFLREVVVVGASDLAGRQDVKARTEFFRRHALGDAAGAGVVQRRALEAFELHVVNIAHELLAEDVGTDHDVGSLEDEWGANTWDIASSAVGLVDDLRRYAALWLGVEEPHQVANGFDFAVKGVAL
jgi:hypothetical protein